MMACIECLQDQRWFSCRLDSCATCNKSFVGYKGALIDPGWCGPFDAARGRVGVVQAWQVTSVRPDVALA
jgi:hypothetical protein